MATSAVLLLLSGCFGGISPMSEFFLLQTTSQKEVVSPLKTTIAVEAVKVPDFLDKPQIVLRQKDSSQVTFSETKRWAEPLSAILQRTLIDDLSVYLPNSYVKTRRYTDETYKYTIAVEVNQMTGTLGGQAVLEVWWSLKNASGVAILREKAQFEQEAGVTYGEYVAAQSRMVAQLAHQIADRLASK